MTLTLDIWTPESPLAVANVQTNLAKGRITVLSPLPVANALICCEHWAGTFAHGGRQTTSKCACLKHAAHECICILNLANLAKGRITILSPFAAARGDKTVMRHFARLVWTLVYRSDGHIEALPTQSEHWQQISQLNVVRATSQLNEEWQNWGVRTPKPRDRITQNLTRVIISLAPALNVVVVIVCHVSL